MGRKHLGHPWPSSAPAASTIALLGQSDHCPASTRCQQTNERIICIISTSENGRTVPSRQAHGRQQNKRYTT